MEWLGIVGAVLSGLIVAAGSVVVARISGRSSSETTLWERVERLEDDVVRLNNEVRQSSRLVSAAATFIDRVGIWIEAGMRTRRPLPPAQLHDLIDTTLWHVDDDEREDRG